MNNGNIVETDIIGLNCVIDAYRDVKKQTSKEIELKHGAAYLLTALFKEHEGKDHVSVGIKYPNGDVEKPMSGKHLYISTFVALSLFLCIVMFYVVVSYT